MANLIPAQSRRKGAADDEASHGDDLSAASFGPAIELPTTADKAIVWFSQYWSTLGTIGLGMVSLLVLRSMVRAVPAAELPRQRSRPARRRAGRR